MWGSSPLLNVIQTTHLSLSNVQDQLGNFSKWGPHLTFKVGPPKIVINGVITGRGPTLLVHCDDLRYFWSSLSRVLKYQMKFQKYNLLTNQPLEKKTFAQKNNLLFLGTNLSHPKNILRIPNNRRGELGKHVRFQNHLLTTAKQRPYGCEFVPNNGLIGPPYGNIVPNNGLMDVNSTQLLYAISDHEIFTVQTCIFISVMKDWI